MAQTFPVLVLCGDRWHPAELVRRGLAPLAELDFSFEWFAGATAWPEERLEEFPLVVLAKTNSISPKDEQPWLTPDADQAFRDFVRRGNGLVAVHGGIAGYDRLPAMRETMGGAFLRHPPECAVSVEAKAGHLLTGGISPFTVTDEHYQVVLDDPRADVFLQSRSEYGVQPAGWTRTEGEGRVCILTPGHNIEVWLYPYFQILLRNAMRWAARI